MSINSPLDSVFDGLDVPLKIQSRLNALKESDYFPFFDPEAYKALCSIVIYAINNGWSEEQIEKLLFNPTKPNTECVAVFRKRHQDIYKEQAIGLADLVDSSVEQFFAISSSMYAGKSTLAAEVCNRLEHKGYRVITMVPHFMSDDNNATFVTLRGRETTENDVVGKDGFARIEAVSYNHENYQQIIENMGIAKDEKVVIHFDEFSFLPAECILEFIQFITVNYSNVKVLFVGLDKNALGQELEGYTAIKESVAAEFACRSFVPNAIDIVDETTEPTGTFTSRYVVLPDGQTVLDCGFLPVVVPKEFAQLVYYTPSNIDHHMYTILQQMEQLELLDSIVNPTDDQMLIRATLFDILKSIIVQES